MERSPQTLAEHAFDLLVVGAGIHGALAAWDATLRGLRVALVDAGDFGAGTSANSLKVVHGGLRYLQSADLPRMRESIAERAALLRIAPDLVEPLAFIVATRRGMTKRSRPAMAAALAITDLVGYDRNREVPEPGIPAGRTLSRGETLERFPGFADVDPTGGALWYDGRMLDSERLTLAFVLSAAARGAVAVNHAPVRCLRITDGRVRGARVRDEETGNELDVDARAVLLALGAGAGPPGLTLPPPHEEVALAWNVVCDRRVADVAIGLQTETSAEDDPICGGHRFVFLVPWRGRTVVGTRYRPLARGEEIRVRREEAVSLLTECNRVCPSLALTADDIRLVHQGVVPLEDGTLADRARVVDHGERDGVSGLISLSGVKYTTARKTAARAVDRVLTILREERAPCRTDRELLLAPRFPLAEASPTEEQLLHAIREESARTLADLVCRRTGLGSAGPPPAESVEEVAAVAARELGWDGARTRREIEDLYRRYP